MKHPSLLCAFGAVLMLGMGCDGAGQGSNSNQLGTLHAKLSDGLSPGVAFVRVDVSRNGAIVASQTISATALSSSLTAGQDAGSAASSPAGSAGNDAQAPVGDAYFVLPPGTYTVTATPLNSDRRPTQVC